MYTILIVDDEKNERTGIERLIRKYGYPLKVLQADSGENALVIFEKSKIDILLTDIKMPFMTGIELIREVHAKGYQPVSIIYSAYGEFEYAKSAIALGVIEYLLKPVNLQEFKKLFEEVLKICGERESERLRKTEQQLYREQEKTGRSIMLQLKNSRRGQEEAHIHLFDKNEVVPIIISGFTNIFSQYGEAYIHDVMECLNENTCYAIRNESQTVFFFSKPKGRRGEDLSLMCGRMIEMTKQKYRSDIFIAAGYPCSDIQMLRSEYEKVSHLLDYQFYVSESMCILADQAVKMKNGRDMLDLYFDKILVEAKLGDLHEMEKEVDKAIDYVENYKGFSSIYVKYSFSEVIKQCCELLGAEDQIIEVTEKVYAAQSLAQVRNTIVSFLNSLSSKSDVKKEKNSIVARVKQYVNESYSDPLLSVALISEQMGISTAYLSSLFKKKTGQNLVKYILECRMNHARELLLTTNLKVSEVGEKVGYLNTSYFISIFRANVECSPAKYRERRLKNE